MDDGRHLLVSITQAIEILDFNIKDPDPISRPEFYSLIMSLLIAQRS
jgi:hypothetical protein